jgi:hypothetical protein
MSKTSPLTASFVSLTRNIYGAHTLEELKSQLGEFTSLLEDHLNRRINIHLIDARTKNSPRPTFKIGDLVFDLTQSPGIATLQQWDGKKLVPLGFDTISGDINLIARGIGSGNNSDLLLGSDGNGRWELKIPEQIPFLATELIPAFSLATAKGQIANSNNLLHYNQVIGMVIEDVPNGAIGQATVDGEVTNNTWAWSPGSKLFLNGTALSVTAPSTGFSQMVAVARNANIIIMKISQAILL